MEVVAERSTGEHGGPVSLPVAYAALNELLLDRPDTATFLRRTAELATSVVPGARCAITVHRGLTAAGRRVDPPGPRTTIPRPRHGRHRDETRDGEIPDEVGSVLSVPLVVDDVTVGTLSLYAGASPFRVADLDRTRAFARQATTALTLLLRESALLALDEHLQEALATRAVIDQAIGVLMQARRISGRDALDSLRRESQAANRKVSVIAAELVLEMTGHPPATPRPLARRPDSPRHHRHDDAEIV